VAPISVTVITRNEAANIDACLTSVAWADERVVVDCGSTDDTVARARALGARVIERDWPGYATQKNFAAEQASHDWILSIDADERVTSALADEVRRTVAASAGIDGYRIPRLTWHLGRWIRTTDWYPDYQLRLYHRQRARWTTRRVHESVAADGRVGRLTEDLQHFAYRDISHHFSTMDRYTTLAAEDMRAHGRRASVTDLVLHPPVAFLRNYILKRGIMDGIPGLIVSVMNAQYVFLKFAKLWVLDRPPAPPPPVTDPPDRD
jgi:glycosyltransferase involved in cell wall biosynthesis